ncbi:MAG: hypothetical protein IPJ41_03560 [Phycisphaerales bacterium]|nr:hypothetical protein [Phycisphaerales bacterium]
MPVRRPNTSRLTRPGRSLFLAAAAGMALSSAGAHAQTTLRYVGASGGLWSAPTNWNPNGVPANDGGNTYNVILPTNLAVKFDLPAPTAITGASFESGSSITLTDTSLEVLGVAILENTAVIASGAGSSFLTNAPFATGKNQRLFASDGAMVLLDLPSYQWTNLSWNSTTLLQSSGPGSLLDLSSMTLVDASVSTSGGSQVYSIIALNEGLIDLSNVTTLKGAGGDEWLRLRVESRGTIDLSKLNQTPSGRTWFELVDGDLELPNLVSALSTNFDVKPDHVLALPSLTAARYGYLTMSPKGTINAPHLTDVTGTYAYLTPTRYLNTPQFTQIDNAHFDVAEGGLLKVADLNYYWNLVNVASTTLMSSSDQGSLLDLSSITLIDASASISGGTQVYSFIASTNGAIDLSNTTTIKGAGNDEWLRFRAESGGIIDLSSLSQITAGNTWFDHVDGQLLLPSLASVVNTNFDVKLFHSLELPSLTSAHGSTFTIASGGMINAPKLTDVYGSYVYLTPSRFFDTPLFTQIDNARLAIAEGGYLGGGHTDYIWNLVNVGSTNLMSSSDQGSLLDLSSITLIDASASISGGTQVYSFIASNNGAIDLSNTTTIKGAGNDEWLRFRSQIGGRIDLSTLNHTAGRLWLDLTDPDSQIVVTSDISLGVVGGAAALSVANLGELHVGGDFIHKITAETSHTTKGGTVFMDGSGVQQFEVAGTDIGLPNDTILNNFDWGAMVVGRDGQPTIVELVDTQNNGNRGGGGEPEALYLSGFPQGEDGLTIKPDSVLVLNGIQAYVGTVDGWVHLNALFGAGEFRIPYGQGYIQLSRCLADWNSDGELDIQDFIAFLNSWAAGDASADLTGDGLVDTRDFVEFLNAWAGGC